MEGMIGEIRLFAGNFAPRDWAFCSGQILSIAEYQALFTILGTTFGGDGMSNFALPDIRGKAVLGPRNGPGLSDYELGETVGTETVTLTTNQLPGHIHPTLVGGGLQTGTGKGESGNPQGNYIDDSAIANDLFKANGGGPVMRGGEGITVVNGKTGGDQAHDNMQPFLALNYVICLEGIYPVRN